MFFEKESIKTKYNSVNWYFSKIDSLIKTYIEENYHECLGLNTKEVVEGFNTWYKSTLVFNKPKFVEKDDFNSIILCGGDLISKKSKRCDFCTSCYLGIDRSLRFQ